MRRDIKRVRTLPHSTLQKDTPTTPRNVSTKKAEQQAHTSYSKSGESAGRQFLCRVQADNTLKQSLRRSRADSNKRKNTNVWSIQLIALKTEADINLPVYHGKSLTV